MFLGSSESVGQNTGLYKSEHKKWKIYRRKLTSSSYQLHFNLLSPPLDDKYADESTGVRKIKQAEELSALQLMETILDESNAPPCALIDDTCNIIYIHDSTGRYLELAEGKASVNILEMARPGLKTLLISAIHKVGADDKQVSFKDVQVQFNSGFLSLDLTV